jgi:tetratricopeptide (TPR) repeat protein
LEKAIAKYDQALQVDPRYSEVYYNRGLAHRRQDELEKALRDYTQAIRLDPEFVAAYSNRGYTYYMMGDLNRALVDFERVLQIDPGNEDAQHSVDIIRKLFDRK